MDRGREHGSRDGMFISADVRRRSQDALAAKPPRKSLVQKGVELYHKYLGNQPEIIYPDRSSEIDNATPLQRTMPISNGLKMPEGKTLKPAGPKQP